MIARSVSMNVGVILIVLPGMESVSRQCLSVRSQVEMCNQPPSRPWRRMTKSSSDPICSTKGIMPLLSRMGVISIILPDAISRMTLCGTNQWPPTTSHPRTISWPARRRTNSSQFP